MSKLWDSETIEGIPSTTGLKPLIWCGHPEAEKDLAVRWLCRDIYGQWSIRPADHRQYQKYVDVATLAACDTRLPTLLITCFGETYHVCPTAYTDVYAGSYIDVSGLVMHRDVAVQVEPLTRRMRLDCDWRNDDQRNMIARSVRALRIAPDSLRNHYTDLFRSTVSNSALASWNGVQN
jgi:hypothetical protein